MAVTSGNTSDELNNVIDICISLSYVSVCKSVLPLGRRTACIFWLVSSPALMLRVVCRLFGAFMSCLTLLTPTWHQPVCLPPPTCSPTCLARAPSSLWVPTRCVISSRNYAGDFWLVHVCMFMYTQELCLYTLGNLCPDSDVVKEKLLAQGIIPALANCIEVN